MNPDTLQATLLNFANNPSKSWGPTDGGEQFLDGKPSSLPITAADRNTARLLSGAYTPEQLALFNSGLALAERYELGTVHFPANTPFSPLEFSLTCTACGEPFGSSLSDAKRCYDCELRVLCPPLPGRRIQHWWYAEERVWTLQVHGDVGFHNQITYWWYNRNSGGNTSHQGLVTDRTAEGQIKKMVFTTVAQGAGCRYRIIFDLTSKTTTFWTARSTFVTDDMHTGQQTELSELDPLAFDLVVAMIPAFMLYKHRPRNPANGCFI